MADNIDPRTLQIYYDLLNIGTAQPEESSPEVPVDLAVQPSAPETTILQRLRERVLGPMYSNLERAFSAGVPAIPAYRLYQKYIGQPFAQQIVEPMLEDIQYVAAGKTKPKSTRAIFPVEEGAPIEEGTTAPSSVVAGKPQKRATPVIPKPGEQVGVPQYTSPEQIIPEEQPTAVPTTPATSVPAPVPIPTEKAIAEGIQLPQKTDFMENFKQIMDAAIPKAEDLPKPEYKKPANMLEWLGEFGRLMALQKAGLSPYEVVKTEEKDIEAKAEKERKYMVARAAQMATLKLTALQEQMRAEETNREREAKWLEFIGTSRPEMKNSLPYVQAVAANRGVPVDQAAKIIRESYDPATGKLNLYVSPVERQIEAQKQEMKWKKDTLVELGIEPERAARVAAGLKEDMGEYLYALYQNAVGKNDMKRANEIKARISTYQNMMQQDPVQAGAVADILEDPKLTKFNLFGQHAAYMKQVRYAQAFGGDKFAEKIPKPEKEKETKVDEIIKRRAYVALSDPIQEKAFRADFKMAPLDVLIKGGEENHLGWPWNMAAKLAPPKTAKDGELLQAWVEGNPEIQRTIKVMAVNKYKNSYDAVNQVLLKNKQPLLDDNEIYRIATAADTGDNNLVWSMVQDILIKRGIVKKEVPKPK